MRAWRPAVERGLLAAEGEVSSWALDEVAWLALAAHLAALGPALARLARLRRDLA